MTKVDVSLLTIADHPGVLQAAEQNDMSAMISYLNEVTPDCDVYGLSLTELPELMKEFLAQFQKIWTDAL